MTQRFLLPFISCLCLPLFALPAQSAEPTIECIGLQVSHISKEMEFSQLNPFSGGKAGTTVALMIRSQDNKIIEIDLDKSKLEAFIDSTRKSLLSGKGSQGGFGDKDGFGPFPKTADDGKVGLVTVRASSVPSKGATKIGVKGTIVAQFGSKTKKLKSDPIELSKGTKVALGGIDFSIKNVGKPSFGNDAQEVTLSTTNSQITTLAGVQFYDGNGKLIESRSGSSGRFGFAGNNTYSQSYLLKTAIQGKATIEFETWTDLEEKEIPFSITTIYGG